MADKNTLDLARQWAADIYADRQTLSQDTIDAAADLISSLPDEWVSIKAIQEWRRKHRGSISDNALKDFSDLLPAPTPPTLADMTPEERAECQWMQAEVDGQAYEGRAVITDIVEAEGKAKTILPSGQQFSFHISIVTPLPELPRMQWPGNVGPEQQALARDIFGSFPSEERHVHWAKPIPKPAAPRTMTEIEWSFSEHHRAEAEHSVCGKVVMMELDGTGYIVVLMDEGLLSVPPSELTPTGRKLRLIPDEDAPEGDPIEIAGDDHASHCASCAEMDDDEPEFDPDYTYSDKDGEHWAYLNHNWRCINYGHDATNYLTPPAKYRPYTRIEKDTNG